VYRYISLTCVSRKFASDMSHCPSKLIKAQKHCHGLLNASKQQTNHYK
jgi:hypothetical protein